MKCTQPARIRLGSRIQLRIRVPLIELFNRETFVKAITRFLKTALVLAVIIIGAGIAYAYSGYYDLSVGSGHTAPVQWYLNTLRHNAIERGAADIEVPPLDQPGMFETGAMSYNQACAGCHGRPGRDPSGSWEPAPPALTRHAWDPAELFWVVRNGIKMSAMPKIGSERVGDEQVWQIAAFLQQASSLTEGEYREMVEPPPEVEPVPEPEPEPAEGEAPENEESEANETETEGNGAEEDSDG